MRGMGEIKKKFGLEGHPFIAFCSAGVMKGNTKVVAVVPGDYPEKCGVEDEGIDDELFVKIDENHSHYVLVDRTKPNYDPQAPDLDWSPVIPGCPKTGQNSATGGRPIIPFGSEIKTRADFENIICSGGSSAGIIPLLTLVYGGGPGTCDTVDKARKNHSPVICVEGSGRFCAVLQEMVEYYGLEENQEVGEQGGGSDQSLISIKLKSSPNAAINTMMRKVLLGQNGICQGEDLEAFEKNNGTLEKILNGHFNKTFSLYFWSITGGAESNLFELVTQALMDDK